MGMTEENAGDLCGAGIPINTGSTGCGLRRDQHLNQNPDLSPDEISSFEHAFVEPLANHDTYGSECRFHVPGTPMHSGGRCEVCDAEDPPPDPPSVAHIAGLEMQKGTQIRQRCAWCGAILIDDDLALMMVPVGQEGSARSYFPVGEWVETYSPDNQGGMWVALDPIPPNEDGHYTAPENSCMNMPHELTA